MMALSFCVDVAIIRPGSPHRPPYALPVYPTARRGGLRGASALSHAKGRIKPSEFHACIFCRKLPMRLRVPGVTLSVPRVYLLDERCFVLYAARKALATQMAEFSLRHVEPTPVFWRIMSLEFIGDSFGFRGIKCFIQ